MSLVYPILFLLSLSFPSELSIFAAGRRLQIKRAHLKIEISFPKTTLHNFPSDNPVEIGGKRRNDTFEKILTRFEKFNYLAKRNWQERFRKRKV